MNDVYVICAVVGGTIFLCQLLLSLLGIGGHHIDTGGHEVGHDVGHGGHSGHGGHGHGHGHGHASHGEHIDQSTAFLYLFSFRALVAGVTFFGLAGMAATHNALGVPVAVAIALGSGLFAMFSVSAMLHVLTKMRSDGTAHIEQALGKIGTVYLSIPGNRGGQGKVTLTVQDRTMEYLAVTNREDLPTGTTVQVVDIVGSDTVEVVAATSALS